MRIQQSSHRGCVVLSLTGRLSLAAAPQVQRAILEQLAEQPPAIICDLGPGGGDRPAMRRGVHLHPPSRTRLAGHRAGAVRHPPGGGRRPSPAGGGATPGDAPHPGAGAGQCPCPTAAAAGAAGAGPGAHRGRRRQGVCGGGVRPVGAWGAGRVGGAAGQRAGHQRRGARPHGAGAAGGAARSPAAGGGARPGTPTWRGCWRPRRGPAAGWAWRS